MTRTLEQHHDRVARAREAEDGSESSEASAAATAHEAHDPHLQHHYDTPQQQYEAAKFGMWLFIATEFLLFGGLFCAYAVYRGNHPEMFQYGAQYLSTMMGAINTTVLILSSLTIAFAVRCAQLNQRRGLVITLVLTFLGGAVFMGIKYVEYKEKFEKNLVWGVAFYEPPEKEAADHADDPDEPMVAVADDVPGDPVHGQQLWMDTCQACHGDRGEGIVGQAFDYRDSDFVWETPDDELLAFIKGGRMPFDPANRTGIQMPPKGGNPLLSDDDLMDIIAYMRTFDPPSDEPGDTGEDAPADDAVVEAPDGEDAATIEEPEPEPEPEPAFRIPKSSVPLAREGPRGIYMARVDQLRPEAHSTGKPPDPREDPDRPANLHLFFGIYFVMTGLHALHVFVGMGVIAWLAVSAWLGRFSSQYFTPVELGGLYWHVVDVIWIFLFPLLYLIH